jgi:hypothetical protein
VLKTKCESKAALLSPEHSALSPELNGGLAQLGEHLLCKQGVVGSIPSTSTNNLAVESGGWQEKTNEL